MREGYRGKKSGRLFKGSRCYGDVLRGKGYEGYLAHMKRQLFQESKLNKKVNTKMSWNKKKKFPRTQFSQKPRAVIIQQARKQILKSKFSISDGKHLIIDLKYYINLYDRRYLYDIASHVYLHCSGKEYCRVAESKMLLTIVSTEKRKIQELHFEKTLTLPLREKK